MSVRTSMYAVVSLAMAGGWVADAPITTKYRVDTRVEQVLDLSSFGQGEQRTTLGMVNFLTITMDDTTGGRTVHVVLDSIVKSDTNPIPVQASLDSARGRTWHALMEPGGKLSNLRRMDSTSGGQVGDLVTNFFPRVKSGAKVGDQWSDTTETDSDQEGQSLTTRTVTNYSVTGTETINGSRALKVETAFSLAQTGEVDQAGNTFAVDGTGTGTSTYYVTQDGRYLGGTTTTTADLQISGAQVPQPIPVQVKNTVTVSTIR